MFSFSKICFDFSQKWSLCLFSWQLCAHTLPVQLPGMSRGSSENCFLFGLVTPKPAFLSCRLQLWKYAVFEVWRRSIFHPFLSGIKNISNTTGDQRALRSFEIAWERGHMPHTSFFPSLPSLFHLIKTLQYKKDR